jgi:precorrin-6B C5,15-methyltransferase / cobalt-precorrin-6B C5,C15-methyltransferase
MVIYWLTLFWKVRMSPEPVIIVGIDMNGPAGLSQTIRDMIDQADELWGDDRLLSQWPEYSQKHVPFGKPLSASIQALKQRSENKRIVILASGDPGFYGIAALVLKMLPIEEVLIYPQVSSLQSAFAKIRIPWHDAALTSAHARSIAEVIGLARRFPKLGVLTDPIQSPGWIAEKLLAAGIPDCRAIVFENLGEEEEKIFDTRLAYLPKLNFAPLNVLLLIHDSGWKPLPTLPHRADNEYQYKNGLITKRDVRMISIGYMKICENDVIWDIGAGSGAVSIEMAEIAWRGKVFAIEKDAECLDCIQANIAHLGVMNVEIVPGVAPQALQDLPAPDIVFMGGSGGNLEEILDQILRSSHYGCRIVANFAVVENLLQAYHWMKDHGWEPGFNEFQFSYGSPIAEGTRLVPINPVFILWGTTPNKETL